MEAVLVPAVAMVVVMVWVIVAVAATYTLVKGAMFKVTEEQDLPW